MGHWLVVLRSRGVFVACLPSVLGHSTLCPFLVQFRSRPLHIRVPIIIEHCEKALSRLEGAGEQLIEMG